MLPALCSILVDISKGSISAIRLFSSPYSRVILALENAAISEGGASGGLPLSNCASFIHSAIAFNSY